MKIKKIVYWVATGLLSVLLLMSSGMYIFQNGMIQQAYQSLGYPTYLIYPLVVAKLTAVVVLLSQKKSILKEWAYAGLFFEFVLAFFAHVMANDGEQMGAVVAMVLLVISYIFGKKIFN
jgi:FtsH-binding integral membrane protein